MQGEPAPRVKFVCETFVNNGSALMFPAPTFAGEPLRFAVVKRHDDGRHVVVDLSCERIEDGTILMANDAFCELCGIAREDLLGRPGAHLWRNPADRERVVALLRRESRVVGQEVPFTDPDGQKRVALLSGQLIQLGGD